jgi:hypothetical protein
MVLNFLIGLTILIFLFIIYRHLKYNIRPDEKPLTEEQINKKIKEDFDKTFADIKKNVNAKNHKN